MAGAPMLTKSSDPVLVVVQLSGGNDFMNTVIPYGDPLYYDFRQTVGVAEDDVLHIDDRYGLHPTLTPLKQMYDEGDVAIISGIGYPEPDRSHFRSMDIWHTAEPTKVVAEGWLGRVIRELGNAGYLRESAGRLRPAHISSGRTTEESAQCFSEDVRARRN